MEKQLQSLFFDVVVKAVMSKIVTAIPFLNWPVVQQIFKVIFNKVASMLYEEIETLGMFMKIDFEVGSQQREYERATRELREVLDNDNLTIYPDEIEKAKDEYKKRLKALISLSNS